MKERESLWGCRERERERKERHMIRIRRAHRGTDSDMARTRYMRQNRRTESDPYLSYHATCLSHQTTTTFSPCLDFLLSSSVSNLSLSNDCATIDGDEGGESEFENPPWIFFLLFFSIFFELQYQFLL